MNFNKLVLLSLVSLFSCLSISAMDINSLQSVAVAMRSIPITNDLLDGISNKLGCVSSKPLKMVKIGIILAASYMIYKGVRSNLLAEEARRQQEAYEAEIGRLVIAQVEARAKEEENRLRLESEAREAEQLAQAHAEAELAYFQYGAHSE